MAANSILAIVPHPDDAEFHAGGLIARFISEGASVHIVTATDGRCGSYRHAGDELAGIRVKEAEAAAKYLGASLEFMGYRDYDLALADANQLRERLVRLIRTRKPDVLISEDPFQADQVHPDHRILAMAVSDAVNFSQLPNVYPQHRDDGIFPHYVKEKFAFTDDPARINCVIDITGFLETKLTAMKLHHSQVDFLVEDVLLQAKAAGLDLQQAAGQSLEDPVQMLIFAMMSQMAEIGKISGVSYAEGYKYTRFHPFIENLLKKP